MKSIVCSKFRVVGAVVLAYVFANVAQAQPGPIKIELTGDNDAIAAAEITVDGLPYTVGTEIHDTIFPTQHCVRVSGTGVRVQRWNKFFHSYRYPQTNDVMWIMGSADPNTTVTHTATVTKNVRYVSPKGRDEEDAGLSSDDPYKTLLYAAQQAPTICIIECAEGDYNEGVYTQNDGADRSRVYDYNKHLLFRGKGIGKSVLWGAIDSTDPSDGRGPDAMRCALFSFNQRSAIQGFTVRDGRVTSAGTESTVSMTRGGAGLYVNFVDCLITNCAAWRGQVVYHGTLTRCRVIGHAVKNTSGGRIFESECQVSSSIIYEAAVDGVAPSMSFDAPLYHCTVYPATGGGNGALIEDTSIYTNCLSYATGGISTSARTKTAGCVWKWSTTSLNPEKQFVSDCTNAYPEVVDWDGRDLRLKDYSPALGAGVMMDDYYKIYCSDVNGNPIIFRNGRPTAGAVHTVIARVSVQATPDFATVQPAGDTLLNPGETVTVSLVDQTRPYVGYLVNGVFVSGTTYSYTAPEAGVVPSPVVISEAVAGTNWYVNANTKTDGDGFTQETPKKTLADLFACDVRSGDVVNLAEGDYNEKTMACNVSSVDQFLCRVVVPAGVTLQATGDRFKTRIFGGSATVESTAAYPGCGSDAIRCVWMGAGARLKGLTLTGGRTESVCVESGTDKTSTREKCYGGGVLARIGAIIEDCFITNCVGRRGSAATGGTFRRCTFLDIGGGTSFLADWATKNYAVGGLENSYVDYSDTYVETAAPVVNCFIGDRTTSGATRNYSLYTRQGRIVRNTICLANIRNSQDSEAVLTNCVYIGFGGYSSKLTNEGFGGKMKLAEIKAGLAGSDWNYTGLSGRDSIYVDVGGSTEWDLAGATDINGSQRVYNRAIDIGPWEWDWRSTYAEAAGEGFTVTQASETVGLDEDGRLELRDGETLQMTYPGKPRRSRMVPVVVTGTGTLTASANGGDAQTVTAADDKWRYRSSSETDTLSYRFDGDGHALLTGVPTTPSFLMILR